MLILGVSAYYHDSAACIIKDGQVLVAIEEERLSRIKHDNNFPYQAIKKCLDITGVNPRDIDHVAYYEKPLLKLERILETFIETWPFSLTPFLKGLPEWLGYKLKIKETIKKLGFKKEKIFFVPHHLSHASACFYPSPFKQAAILTIDGVGEWQTTGLWLGNQNSIKSLKYLNFPHSLGLLYSTLTSFLGFRINEDEYKLMGLAAYGKPNLVHKVYKVIKVYKDGRFRLNLKYFGFRESFTMYNNRFIKLFGLPRKPEDKITQKHADLAASIQMVTEEIYYKILNYLYSLTKSKNLCISGGVALNALANGKIYKKTPFKNVYVFGAAGDSGDAVGAALYTHNVILRCEGTMNLAKRNKINNLYFGSEYSNDQIEQTLKKHKLRYKKFTNEDELIDKTAKLLVQGKIIGWFQGRMEFGPRALGNRSILCRPNPRLMKTKMNLIKRREQFRPFAGSVLQEKISGLFEVPEKSHWSPFMTFCFQVKPFAQEELSAIVHKDKSCRVQTVSEENGLYYKLIKRFNEITRISCVLNTSFNLKGEPIVENPEQAVKDFLKTKMDYLVTGEFLVTRK